MIVVIVEDEVTVANRIERLTRDLLNEYLTHLKVFHHFDEAIDYLEKTPIDLLLLDLNIHGSDGFDLLKMTAAGSYHTIIISAYEEKAVDAFAYGVLDFVPKPFTKKRLSKAFQRILDQHAHHGSHTKYLAYKKSGAIERISLDRIKFIRGADYYSEIVLDNGDCEIHSKTLSKLIVVLPTRFARVHKSYIVNMQKARRLQVYVGSRYELEFTDGECLPVGRTRYREVKERFFS